MNTITINGKQLPIREYDGERVVTFKDIDTVHGRPDGTTSRNFRDNRKRFIEGIDYFRRNSSEAKTEFDIIAPNGLILITESGYLMLVKSFTDDLAWDVQRQLVSCYFRVKSPEPEQLTLETSEYHYFKKTLNGEPVMTLSDFSHLTGVKVEAVRWALKRYCKQDVDYFLLQRRDLVELKTNIPGLRKHYSMLIVMTAAAVEKLEEYYGYVGRAAPYLEDKRSPAPQTHNPVNANNCITALETLRDALDNAIKALSQ